MSHHPILLRGSILRATACAVVALAVAGCGGGGAGPADVGSGGAEPFGRFAAPVVTGEPTDAPLVAVPVSGVSGGSVRQEAPSALPSRTPSALERALAMLGRATATVGTDPAGPSGAAGGGATTSSGSASGATTGGSGSGGGQAGVPTRTPRPGSGVLAVATSTPLYTSGPVLPGPTPTLAPRAPSPSPGATADTSILGALRRGGHVIFLRHAHTDWANQDARELEWIEEVKADMGNASLFAQCDRQRLLTGEGRDEARGIGDAFRRLGLPVGRVLSSPWCRTRETANLAFGRVEVAADRVWDTGYLASMPDERERFGDALRGLLSSNPGGANMVIVGHGPQLWDVTGISLEEGQAAIMRPNGGGFDVVRDRVAPGDWDGLGGG